jgi:hypothetical protein
MVFYVQGTKKVPYRFQPPILAPFRASIRPK